MKLAILGAGMIVQDFLSMSHELPEIDLMAIVGLDRDLDEMLELKKEFNIAQVYTDYDQCLQSENIDTVYVGLPNSLHFPYAKKALLSGKHVICEKPFTLNLEEAEELKNIALEKDLVLVEAMTNQYSETYLSLKEAVKNIGEIKFIECNTSHYSSRYELFKSGTILPAFDPRMGGGALLDLNIYNIHFVVGIFGTPKSVKYFANMKNNIDTSGVLIMDYGSFKAICVGAKDSANYSPASIQGEKGSIIVSGPLNIVESYTEQFSHSEKRIVDLSTSHHRMYSEFKKFEEVIQKHDMKFVKEKLDHSLDVMKVVDKALKDVNIKMGV